MIELVKGIKCCKTLQNLSIKNVFLEINAASKLEFVVVVATMQYRKIELEGIDGKALCCCEYYNRDRARFHILGCCCDCVHLDEFCTR